MTKKILLIRGGDKGTIQDKAYMSGMDHQTILQHLALAERHIVEGEERLVRQQELIAELDRDGHDTKQARAILATMQVTQALHYQDRELILTELEQ
jgi:hypothetical protein